MVSSEIRVFIKTRRQELKGLHLKQNKNRKEAERIQTADMPFGRIGYGSVGSALRPIGLRSDGGILTSWYSGEDYSRKSFYASESSSPTYRTEMTPRGMRIITSLGNGEEHSTFLSRDEIDKIGLTESKAIDMLRGLKF